MDRPEKRYAHKSAAAHKRFTAPQQQQATNLIPGKVNPSASYQPELILPGAIQTTGIVAVNGLVYAVAWAGMIYAINPASGSVVWSRQLGATQTNCDDFAAGSEIVGIIVTPTIDPRAVDPHCSAPKPCTPLPHLSMNTIHQMLSLTTARPSPLRH
jgi:hypothetical protein